MTTSNDASPNIDMMDLCRSPCRQRRPAAASVEGEEHRARRARLLARLEREDASDEDLRVERYRQGNYPPVAGRPAPPRRTGTMSTDEARTTTRAEMST
jgi:hypothetical protein